MGQKRRLEYIKKYLFTLTINYICYKILNIEYKFCSVLARRAELWQMTLKLRLKLWKKAIDVLNCFLIKQPLGVTEISEMLGLYKSNVHNILSTFAATGYLTKDEISEKYYLGEKIIFLSRAIGVGII